MRVRTLIDVSFTEEEVKDALILLLDCELNDTVAGTPEHSEKQKILNHIVNGNTSVDFDGKRFWLMVDGQYTEEDF